VNVRESLGAYASLAADLPAELSRAIEGVRPRLGRLASHVHFFPTVGSTSDVAVAVASHGDHEGTVVIADEQTAGRGRRGHRWFSPPLSGLYVSVLLTPARASRSPDRATALLTLAAGVALSEAIETVTGLRPDIKWPNDLRIGRRKLAGILADGIVAGRTADEGRSAVTQVVLGYGINVGHMAYPPELARQATSLESELGRAIDRATLCAETLATLAGRYDDLLEGRFDAILEAWRVRFLAARGSRVTWDTPSGLQSGVAEDVDEWGALLVRAAGRVERIVAGELRWE
jgi:BirA family biotin operon repressor/biotin-[acetyl-CoA-carboxylase] ligase